MSARTARLYSHVLDTRRHMGPRASLEDAEQEYERYTAVIEAVEVFNREGGSRAQADLQARCEEYLKHYAPDKG